MNIVCMQCESPSISFADSSSRVMLLLASLDTAFCISFLPVKDLRRIVLPCKTVAALGAALYYRFCSSSVVLQ